MTKTQQGAVLTQPFNYTLDQWISIIELLKRASSKLVDENNYVRERGERPGSFDEICPRTPERRRYLFVAKEGPVAKRPIRKKMDPGRYRARACAPGLDRRGG
jgi:hypothetical protein